MTLDLETLRAAFCVLALSLLVLFYFVTFRTTRSPYSGWWCLALSMFLAGSAAYLLDGTEQQWWGNPTGNVLLVTGAASVWAGARSFRTARPPMWQLICLATVIAVASGVDHPGTNTWSGGAVFLAGMSVSIGLASLELWRLESSSPPVHVPMAVASAVTSVFYLSRCLAFLAVGPHGTVFALYLGSATTTLVTMVLLVVVSFSITALSNDQVTSDLKRQASQDGLTGLLNRARFFDLAANELGRMRRARTSGSLILADLDHFKTVNDTYGHGAGDIALRLFAEACAAMVRSTDLVGRYGGEEFVMLLPGASAAAAEDVARQISGQLRTANRQLEFRMPTVSYGIVQVDPTETNLDMAIEAADAALYRAKASGRDRAMHGLTAA